MVIPIMKESFAVMESVPVGRNKDLEPDPFAWLAVLGNGQAGYRKDFP